MELSLDKNYVFCGGNTHPNQQTKRTTALLSAVSFQRDLRVVHEIELKELDPTVVFCIKRANNENTIFAGCMKSVFILEWKDFKFELLMIAVDLHTSIISDMCIFGKKLYTVGRKDKFISILDFDVDL